MNEDNNALENDRDTILPGQDCPGCGMPKEDWRGNGGEGFQLGEVIYCCQGCATGAGCTCQ